MNDAEVSLCTLLIAVSGAASAGLLVAAWWIVPLGFVGVVAAIVTATLTMLHARHHDSGRMDERLSRIVRRVIQEEQLTMLDR
jgi:hypothetical protein